MKKMCLKKENILLANHRVLDRGIFPAVGYFELVLKELISRDMPKMNFPIKISDTIWPAPLACNTKKKQVYINLQKKAPGFLYDVTTKTKKGTIVHARGKLSFLAAIKQDAEPIDINQISNQFKRIKNNNSCYKTFEKIGITYKDLFRSVQEFKWNQDESLAKICVPGNDADFKLNPGFLDAAIQCVLLHISKCHDSSCVHIPFSLKDWKFYHELPDTGFVHTILKEANPEKGYYIYDLMLFDENGYLKAAAKEICIKAYDSGDKEKSTEEPQEKWAVAATFTAEPIKAPLAFWQKQIQNDATVHFAPYNQVFQELLDPLSLLSQNQSGANIILSRLEDFKDHSRSGPAHPSNFHREEEEKDKILKDSKRFVLPNGMEIAHLNPYETRYLYDEIFVKKTYLKQGICLPKDAVVIDIGANIGMFSLFIAHLSPLARLYCCEPSPVTFDILKRNMALYAPDATPCNLGISDANHEAEFTFYPRSSVFSGFHTNKEQDGAALRKAMENELLDRNPSLDKEQIQSHLDDMVSDRLEKKTYTCRLRTLSSLLTKYDIQQIDLLKIDAEKCEWDILSSLEDEDWIKIQQVVVEVHDENGDLLDNVKALLKQKGFQVSILEEELLQSSGLYNIYGKRFKIAERSSETESGIEKNINQFISLVKNFSKTSQVPVLLGLCPPSPMARECLSNTFSLKMETLLIRQLKDHSNVWVVRFSDYKEIYQWQKYYDAVRDKMGRIPFTPEFFNAMASILVRRLFVENLEPRKVIALDCDNTLWKGIVGEQGTEGIKIGHGFRELQKFMIRQKEKGMLLCLVSKNNEADVKDVFLNRDDMVLKRDDITGLKINWETKSSNLSALAQELNLSLDSFIFLDDSPMECAQVRAAAPQVLTLQMPEKEEEIIDFLNHIWVFDQKGSTKEDAKRTELYKQNMEREKFRKKNLSFSDFISGLELSIRITPAHN
ncbi:MAG: FkbM family methyltransferase [Desulfobacteraceae bacterium]|nr:FkbM family methyltransferase [Desulfobacteraceae bacterium]